MFSTIKAQRLLTSIKINNSSSDQQNYDQLQAVSRSLWRRIWRDDLPIDDEDGLREACESGELVGIGVN